MRKILSSFVIAAMFALAIIPSTGCTLGAQQQAVVVEYQTLSGVINVVDVARGVYNAAYNAGKVPAELDAKVATAYTQYQQIANLAVSTARAQDVLVTAGVAPSALPNNPYIVQLEGLINTLIALFNGATPSVPPTPPVSIARNARS